MNMSVDILYDSRVVTLLFGLVVPFLIYKLATRNHNYWKIRRVPCAKAYPFLGSIPEAFGKNLETLECERYDKLGRIHGIYEASTPVLIVAEPEIIKNLLVKDFQHFTDRRKFESGDPAMDKMMFISHGEDWKRLRMIVSPTFSTGKIKRLVEMYIVETVSSSACVVETFVIFIESIVKSIHARLSTKELQKVMRIFQECSKTVFQNLKMESTKNNSVDVMKIYGAYTVDVIASSAFSTKLDSHNDPENIFVKMAKRAFSQGLSIKSLFIFVLPRLSTFLKLAFFDKESWTFFKRVTMGIIEERKKTGQTQEDFLQMLTDIATEVAEEEKLDEKSNDIAANYGEDTMNHPIFKGSITKHLSMDELVAQCIVFFLGGYHTTTTTLSVATYLLALHQEEQDRIFQEIKDVLSVTDGELTYESVQKMKHLDNVISESLRMYSPFLRIERRAAVDYPLGNTGITVPKGMTIGIPIFAMHRDPKLFPDPEKFIPNRFSPEERDKLTPYSYLPFGAGPRNCVAMRFALLEMKVCLIYVFSVFNVHLSSESKVPLEFERSGGLLTPKPVHLRLERRNNCPLKV